MSPRSVVRQLPRHAVVGSLLAAAALIALGVAPHGLGPQLARAFGALGDADPLPLCLACGLFVVSLLCSANAWRTGVSSCGGRMGRNEAAGSYGLGSLTNSLLPARVGDAVRVALFSRTLPREGRLWTMSGVLVALSVARAAVLAALLVVAAALGALPLWPLAALAGIVAIAIALATRLRRTQSPSRMPHLFDAFRALGRSPRTSCVLAGWAAGSIAARVAAAAATAAAVGASSPLLAALVIVPALELSGLLPLTPGGVGIATGAVAVALHTTGMPLTEALTIGIALHPVEMLAGVGFGTWSLLYLAGGRPRRARTVSRLVSGRAEWVPPRSPMPG
jgi:uncharacterized membrane protein YbhN (UPF0104 family)